MPQFLDHLPQDATPDLADTIDRIVGSEGPMGHDFNMRWIASLVAEAHPILTRSGVFPYPGDTRPG